MAIKIIDDKPHHSVVKRAICKNCGATLEYVPADTYPLTHHDYGGGSDTYDYIDCPKCSQAVRV